MALFEKALYLTNPEGYELLVSNLLDPNIEETIKLNIIQSAFKDTVNPEDLVKIKSIYDFIIINKQIKQQSKDI